MTKQGELWQRFVSNGQTKVASEVREGQKEQDKIVGSAHVWIWRRGAEGDVEVLVQLRSADMRSWPNYWDISAAGHIKAGETILETAVNETDEETNIKLDPGRLDWIFSDRAIDEGYDEFRHVFLYEMTGEPELRFNDGEVVALKWVSLLDLKEWVANPDGRLEKIVPHAPCYFVQLFEWLERIDERRVRR